jgi:energy-coupling factor transporter ATP-binding protein EcfA2
VASLMASLHGGHRRLPLGSSWRLGLTLVALVANGALSSPALSMVLFMAASALLIIDGIYWSRAWPFALPLFSGVACVLAGWLAGSRPDELVRLATRLAVGLVWMAWAGLTCRWGELRALLERLRLHTAADTIESAMVHGELLLHELQRGREAVLVRHGGRDLHLQTVGILLAGAFERGLGRASTLDETRALRAANVTIGQTDKVLDIDQASVDGCCGPARLIDVSLCIRQGEWVALAGPSGSGKTTLLRLAAGLLAPDRGQMHRFGYRVSAQSLSARVDGRVSMVFQDPNDQILGTTPVEDVAWGLRHRGLSRAEAESRARAQLDRIGIGRLADRPVHELSFGERKRVAFAAALVTRPTLLLCDEPTMGLDPVAAANLVIAVEAASADGLATLWATHDLLTLPKPTQRLVLLSAGAIAFDGSCAEGFSLDRLRQAGLAR